jgi:hypothetical protein
MASFRAAAARHANNSVSTAFGAVVILSSETELHLMYSKEDLPGTTTPLQLRRNRRLRNSTAGFLERRSFAVLSTQARKGILL